MKNYKEQLEHQLVEIEGLISKSNMILLKLNDLPEDKIIVSRSNGCNQYYWNESGSNKRRYARKSEYNLIKKVAQREYQTALNKRLYKLQKNLKQFIDNYNIEELSAFYAEMSDARKQLIIPLIEPDDLFIQKWKADEYSPMPFSNDTQYYSNEGVRVRSKSELIIANQLEYYGIPYKYEKPLVLYGNIKMRPDFECLNIRTREELLWEHLGMMDNISYANKNVNKINIYQQNGFFPGKNMILSFETSTNSLSSKTVNSLIENYLL